MRISLRNRILLTFVLVIIGFSAIGALMGTYFINKTTIMEEQRRVSVDLRSAWSVLQGKGDELTILVSVLGTGQRVANAYSEPDRQTYRASLENVRRQFKLDFLTLTDNQGRVILRTRTPFAAGDDLSGDPFVRAALSGQAKSGFLPARSRTAEERGRRPDRKGLRGLRTDHPRPNSGPKPARIPVWP